MELTTEKVTLRKLTASEGMVITDTETETMRAEVIYLGKEDNESNYKEIPYDIPWPEQKESEE